MDCRKRRVRGMRGSASLLRKDVRKPVAEHTVLSAPDRFIRPRVAQMWKEEAVSVRNCSTNFEQLIERLLDKNKGSMLSSIAYGAASWIIEFAAEQHVPLIRLNDYKMQKESLERKTSEQKDIVRLMTASMTRGEKRVCFLENKKGCFRDQRRANRWIC